MITSSLRFHRCFPRSFDLPGQSLSQLACRRRVLLSGTPMQNDLNEFFAMVDFTNPDLLGDAANFRYVAVWVFTVSCWAVCSHRWAQLCLCHLHAPSCPPHGHFLPPGICVLGVSGAVAICPSGGSTRRPSLLGVNLGRQNAKSPPHQMLPRSFLRLYVCSSACRRPITRCNL